jgi:hypothetical protein
MKQATTRERLAAAQACVRAARALLLCPRTCDLDRCTGLFREAQSELEGLRGSFDADLGDGGELRRQAYDLRREIGQAGALLEQAARFGRHWLERLRAATGGYTAAGVPAAVPGCGQISVVG